MSMLARALLVAAFLTNTLIAAPETGDLRKSKAYLREVKKHLLESFIDSDRVKEEDLIVAGLKAMAAAMDGKSFESLGKDARAAVREAVLAQASLEGGLQAAEEAASDLDLIALADHAARAMVATTGDPYSHLFTDEEMQRLAKALQG